MQSSISSQAPVGRGARGNQSADLNVQKGQSGLFYASVDPRVAVFLTKKSELIAVLLLGLFGGAVRRMYNGKRRLRNLMQEHFGFSRTTVDRSIESLVKEDWIRVEDETTYCLCDTIGGASGRQDRRWRQDKNYERPRVHVAASVLFGFLNDCDSTALRVWLLLMFHSNARKGYTTLGNGSLSDILGRSERCVQRAQRSLQKLRLTRRCTLGGRTRTYMNRVEPMDAVRFERRLQKAKEARSVGVHGEGWGEVECLSVGGLVDKHVASDVQKRHPLGAKTSPSVCKNVTHNQNREPRTLEPKHRTSSLSARARVCRGEGKKSVGEMGGERVEYSETVRAVFATLFSILRPLSWSSQHEQRFLRRLEACLELVSPCELIARAWMYRTHADYHVSPLQWIETTFESWQYRASKPNDLCPKRTKALAMKKAQGWFSHAMGALQHPKRYEAQELADRAESTSAQTEYERGCAILPHTYQNTYPKVLWIPKAQARGEKSRWRICKTETGAPIWAFCVYEDDWGSMSRNHREFAWETLSDEIRAHLREHVAPELVF